MDQAQKETLADFPVRDFTTPFDQMRYNVEVARQRTAQFRSTLPELWEKTPLSEDMRTAYASSALMVGTTISTMVRATMEELHRFCSIPNMPAGTLDLAIRSAFAALSALFPLYSELVCGLMAMANGPEGADSDVDKMIASIEALFVEVDAKTGEPINKPTKH